MKALAGAVTCAVSSSGSIQNLRKEREKTIIGSCTISKPCKKVTCHHYKVWAGILSPVLRMRRFREHQRQCWPLAWNGRAYLCARRVLH
jgi:hypothetical protein